MTKLGYSGGYWSSGRGLRPRRPPEKIRHERPAGQATAMTTFLVSGPIPLLRVLAEIAL